MKLELLLPPDALSSLSTTTTNHFGSGGASNGSGFRRGGGFNNSRGRGFRRGGRGGSFSASKGGQTQSQVPTKTQQELDAEMEEYLAQSGDAVSNRSVSSCKARLH